MKRLKVGVFLAGLVVALGVGCRAAMEDRGDRPTLHVMVSIPPQAYVVERIGGDAVAVEAIVPPGAEPHTYEPRPEQLRAMSQADVYFQIRIDFEAAWLPRFAAANPHLQIIDTTQGIERMPLPGDEAGAEVEAGDRLDPHTWLSPRLMKVQAHTIATTLSQLSPEEAAQFQANLATFERDLDALDAEIRQTLQGIQNRQFLVFHPAWGYFARDYDLHMLAVEVGGQEPSAAEMANLIRIAQEHQIRVVFASPQFSQRNAETIAQEIGGEVLLIDPLAYDWPTNLRQVAQTLAEVLQSAPTQQSWLIPGWFGSGPTIPDDPPQSALIHETLHPVSSLSRRARGDLPSPPRGQEP